MSGLSSKGYIVRDRAFDVVSVQGTLKADYICSTSSDGKVRFKSGGATGETIKVCMTIDSTGNIGFNKDSPAAQVHFGPRDPLVSENTEIMFEGLPTLDGVDDATKLAGLATGRLYADASGFLKLKQ